MIAPGAAKLIFHKNQKHKSLINIARLVYLNNPVGIGEHPQHLDEVNKLLAKIAEAKDKLEALEDFDG